MKLTAIKAILKKDILDGLKNYQIIIMVLTPIFLSLLFNKIVLKGNSNRNSLPELGFISSPQQPLIESLISKGMKEKITFYLDKTQLEQALLEGKVKFGLILPDIITGKAIEKKSNLSVTLLYPPSLPDFAAETIRHSFENLLREQLNIKTPPLPFELKIEAVGTSSGKLSSSDKFLPMLILMAIGVIGFLALPMSIVEEREKGTLNAIFLTPITPGEFIIGKSLFSFFLILLSVCSIITLNGKWDSNFCYILLMASIGGLTTIFVGFIISMFAKNQASVNAIGTLLFLLYQMVPTLQQSDVMKTIAPFIPSTYIFDGIKKAIYMDLSKFGIHNEIVVSTCIMLAFYLVAFFIYKIKKADK